VYRWLLLLILSFTPRSSFRTKIKAAASGKVFFFWMFYQCYLHT
jgi:hypothetical protein